MDIEDLMNDLLTGLHVHMDTSTPVNMYSDMDMNDLVAEFTTRFRPFSQKHHDNRWLMISRLLEDDMAKGYDL